MSCETPSFRRILVKISGEALSGEGMSGISTEPLQYIIDEIKTVLAKGIETAIVLGGGNILRGGNLARTSSIRRFSADYMGMLGTIINGLALKETMRAEGMPVRLMSSIQMLDVCEYYTIEAALEYLARGDAVILAGGTGRPFFTTDTTAALRSVELGLDVFIKGTKVDGVYSADPVKDSNAERFEKLTFDQAVQGNYGVMDSTAFAMCRDNGLPALVINFFQKGSLLKAVCGEKTGTFIGG